MQRVVHLLALFEEGRTVKQRVRIPREIENRYQLICGIPEEGGYAQPLKIGTEGTELFDGQSIDSVARKTKTVIRVIDSGDKEDLEREIPEESFRKNVVSAFDSMIPHRRYGVVVNIEDHKRERILSGKKARDSITRLRIRPEPEPEATLAYVTGVLIEMKFEERRLRLKMPISGRALDATYGDDFEPVLLDHPREMIQVHGNVTFDDAGPVSISDVDEVIEVDESPIEMQSFDSNSITLHAIKPPVFNVRFDNDILSYELIGPFDVYLYAETQPQLEMLLQEEMAMLWQEYAMADPELLTEAAKKLREELLATFEEVEDGS